MSKIGTIFNRLDRWFIALSKRERIIVLLALFLLPIYLFAELVYQPNQHQQKKLHKQQQSAQNNNEALQSQLVELEAALRNDPDEKQHKQVNQLHQQIAQFDESLRSNLAGMVPPQQMSQLLRDMVHKQTGLILTALKNLPPQSLLVADNADGVEGVDGKQATKENDKDNDKEKDSFVAGSPTLYRHGIEVKFTGSYLATLKYLQRLQGLSQRLFWDNVKIEMSDKYPINEVTINVYTLSFQEGWIGG